MLGEKLDKIGFQTFYPSKEQSRCPAIPEIVKLYKRLVHENLLDDNSFAIISVRYGKRILINIPSYNNSCSKIEDFLEIVDYDPIKKNIVAIGPGNPCHEIPLHWLVHNARRDINSIVQVNNIKIIAGTTNEPK